MIRNHLIHDAALNETDYLYFIKFIHKLEIPIDLKVLLKLITQYGMRPRLVLDMSKHDLGFFANKPYLFFCHLLKLNDNDLILFLSFLESNEYNERVKLFLNTSNSSDIPLFLSPKGDKYSMETVCGLLTQQYKSHSKGYPASRKFPPLHSFRRYAINQILSKS